ncbi:MAG: 2-hydroxy-3-oxopropionate reductase [Acetobacteraceae bacterium]|nr:2-hydroxy-3-oxopropionate reductase [Acetobacteraceae bacterium]
MGRLRIQAGNRNQRRPRLGVGLSRQAILTQPFGGDTTNMNVGFIGLGIMGQPMALHLVKGGHTLYAHTRSGVPAALKEAGAQESASPKDIAERADVIITMLPDTPDVERVLFGENGVAEGLSSGKIVVDMSSISPIATKAFAERIEAKGCEYVDAPVSGGDVGAKAGSLTIMAGGKQAAFDRVKPLFELMGKNITLVGGAGDGQTTKVANQIIVALTIEAVGEALLFAAKAGADPAKVRGALMGGFANSRILELHGERMVKRNFDPGFRIELHQKDLNLALQGAKELQMSLPNTASCLQLFNACTAQGGGKWDHSGMVRALETLANFSIGGTAKG